MKTSDVEAEKCMLSATQHCFGLPGSASRCGWSLRPLNVFFGTSVEASNDKGTSSSVSVSGIVSSS